MKVIWYEPSGERDLKLLGPLVDGRMSVDRLGTLNEFNWDYENIPKDFSDAKSWDECCLTRAEELWGIGKPITVLWSGGIDSSVVFLSLLETKPSDGELHVHYSQQSIDEFPSLYETVKEFSPPSFLPPVEYFNSSFLKKDHMFVTGEPADPIFGTSAVKKYIDIINDPWDTVLYLDDFHPHDLSVSDRYRISCLLEEHVERCPIEIKTIFDVAWWISFCFKYTFVDRCIFLSYFQNDGTDLHKNYSFFNTIDFQKWSMCFHHLKHQNTWTSYKKPAKDFIYKFTGDDDYYANKTKDPSILKLLDNDFWFTRYRSQDRLKLLLDDGRMWRQKDIIPEDILNECRK